MAIKRECTEITVLARITERAGIRFQSSQLATYYGVKYADMTKILVKLTEDGKVRRVFNGGNPTVYYIPSQSELNAERQMRANQEDSGAWSASATLKIWRRETA